MSVLGIGGWNRLLCCCQYLIHSFCHFFCACPGSLGARRHTHHLSRALHLRAEPGGTVKETSTAYLDRAHWLWYAGPHGKQYPQSSSRPLCNPIIQCQGYLSLHHLCCIQIKGQRYTYSHTAPHQHLNCQCLPLATHCTLRPSNTRRNITPVLKYPAITNQGKGYLQHTAH